MSLLNRFLRTKSLIAALVLSWAFMSSGSAASTLNFPRLDFDTGTFTGVAFVNPTGATATLLVTAYGPDGSKLQGGSSFVNPASVEVPAFRQRALVLSEIFGADLDPEKFGWMQATTEADGVTGFFLYLNGSVSFFDGADLPVTSRKLFFPESELEKGIRPS